MNFYWSVWVTFGAMGLPVLPILLMITAPYGKFTRSGWGHILPGRLCWMIQECPNSFIALYFLYHSNNIDFPSLTMLLLYLIHHIQRCFIYGYLMSPQSTTTSSMVLCGIFFNIVNCYLQTAGLSCHDKSNAGYLQPRFWFGVFIWLLGCCGNILSDSTLRALRKPGEKGYKIPYGGMFRYVSAANYFCECVEWLGWAIACQNYSAWMQLFLSVANLLPRAISQHRWYLENFKIYSSLNRKAFIPLLL